MKKGILATLSVALAVAGTMFFFNASSVAGMSYECWTYVNGSPDKMIKVVAENKADAEAQAPARFRDLGVRWDYIQCK